MPHQTNIFGLRPLKVQWKTLKYKLSATFRDLLGPAVLPKRSLPRFHMTFISLSVDSLFLLNKVSIQRGWHLQILIAWSRNLLSISRDQEISHFGTLLGETSRMAKIRFQSKSPLIQWRCPTPTTLDFEIPNFQATIDPSGGFNSVWFHVPRYRIDRW